MNTKLLTFNPELARNFKLELSNQRLILMPFVLILLSVLTVSFGSEASWNNKNIYDVLAGYAIGAFGLIVYLWGAKTAADGILDEYNNRTWDWQKTSALSPFKMTIGKLFGSTIYNWYGGIICLGIYFFAAINSEFVSPKIVLVTVINSVLTGLAIHGFAMLAALMQIRKGEGRDKIKSTSSIVFALIVLVTLFAGFDTFQVYFNELSRNIFWYGINFGFFGFLLKTLFFTAWVIAGLYRSMRTELQYLNGLKWWVFFLISIGVFYAGFFIRGDEFQLEPLMLITVVIASLTSVYFLLTFMMAFSEPKEFVQLKQCINNLKTKNYQKFYQTVPLWALTIVFATFAAIITSILFSLQSSHAETSNQTLTNISSAGFSFILDYVKENISKYALVPIAALGFLIRDVAIILMVNFSGKKKRADATAMLFLVLLYVVAPILVRNAGLTAFFFPTVNEGNLLMVLAPWLQAAIVIYFLVTTWKKLGNQAKF